MESGNDRKLAIHAAAHAVIGQLLGSPVESVTVVADEDEGSAGHPINFHGDPYSDLGGEAWNLAMRAVCCYAGHMATIKLGYEEDFKTAGAYSDYLEAAYAMDSLSDLDPDRSDFLRNRLLEISRLFVEMAWQSIELVAEELEVRKTIGHEELARILDPAP